MEERKLGYFLCVLSCLVLSCGCCFVVTWKKVYFLFVQWWILSTTCAKSDKPKRHIQWGTRDREKKTTLVRFNYSHCLYAGASLLWILRELTKSTATTIIAAWYTFIWTSRPYSEYYECEFVRIFAHFFRFVFIHLSLCSFHISLSVLWVFFRFFWHQPKQWTQQKHTPSINICTPRRENLFVHEKQKENRNSGN